jgi:hypothetical protein
MGYPGIEALLEQDKPDLSAMLASHAQLVELCKAKAGISKEKAAAKNAGLAYDQFFHLFSDLLQVKQKMISEQTLKGAASKKNRR